MDISEFKPIDGFDGRYLIDRDGNILSMYRQNHKYLDDRPMLMHPSLDKNGYKIVSLFNKNTNSKKSYRVHRLVALTYLPNPENKKYVCHKDNNPLNCNVKNLYWGTNSENIKQAFEDGLCKKAQPVAQLDFEGNIIAVYLNQADAGRKTGNNRHKVSNYLYRVRKNHTKKVKWKKITREEYIYYKEVLQHN